jgi:4-amino-4-deoxy-L-arabinose transferase-like glycosyltransferase
MSASSSSPRRFAVALGLLCALALLLRAWAPASFGIDHFDEGVYAFSASAAADPAAGAGLYPEQEKFSPPLYFGLGGLAARASGADVDRVLVGLNALLGAATVGLLGWVARRWFGASAGLAAATLLALSEYHIALSRAALTDVAFALAHLGAVYVLVEAVRSGRCRAAVAAGVCAGLAWNTKYHGWLAIVSVALGSAPLLVSRARRQEDWRRPLLVGLVASGTAVMTFAPWAAYIEAQPGGYAGLAEHQSTMLRGAWRENLWRQLTQQLYFEGPFSAASLPLALAAAAFAIPQRTRAWAALCMPAALAALALVVGASVGAFALAACAVLPLLRRARALDLPACVLLAWLVLWSLLTPLYQPYARLLLPLSIGGMLAAGVALQDLSERHTSPNGARRALLAGSAALVALLTFALAQLRDDPSDPWRNSRGMHAAAVELGAALPRGARVFVLGEPGLAWYLEREGFDAAQVVKGPDCLARLERDARETFVVCGIYPRRNGAEAKLVEGAGARLALVVEVPLEVKDLRLLDDFAPFAAARFRREPGDDYSVRLYRYRPSAR